MKLALLLAAGLVALALVAAQFSAFAGQPPTDLGVTNGRLKPPSATRNSVSSQAHLYADHPQKAYATIEPLALKAGGATASLADLERALASVPGISVVERQPDYLRAEATTRWLRFVDDLEFWVNPQRRVIELRSASRLGREDFGANRKRIEAIRALYQVAP